MMNPGQDDDRGRHLILVVDDIRDNVTMLMAHLETRGYRTTGAYGGIDALRLAVKQPPDLVMLDINMPQMSGLDVCSQLRQRPETSHTPVILVTANSEPEDIVRGFNVGADDYLIKPFNYMEMLARVRSMLRIKDTQQELRDANAALDELNHNLAQKVKEQVQELERVNRLRRFFSPQIVNTIINDAEQMLREHRREITVVFLDLRNFTSFAEKAEPELVLRTVRELHSTVGPIIFRYGGTLERFTGDGLMVFLGDPEPMPDHPTQAVRMAIEIREAVRQLWHTWVAKGFNLGLGIGISTGVASLGTIGFEGRLDYAAIGSVTNLAARLCSMAEDGQILVSESTHLMVDAGLGGNFQQETDLKGFSQTQAIYEIP